MKILVVDDESPARDLLRILLAETDGDHELAGEAANGWEAIARCRSQPIDLVLLDAQMPDMTGLEAARQLALLDSPPTVILIATSDQTALRGAERQVADCLFKPVRRDRLEKALRLARAHASSNSRPTRGQTEDPPDPPSKRRRHISAHYRGELQRVAVEDVIYLRAEHKYVIVRHLRGEMLVDESLRAFEREFPDLFVRIHRNALVARSQLVGLEKNEKGVVQARLRECDEGLPVSRRHLGDIRRRLRDQDE